MHKRFSKTVLILFHSFTIASSQVPNGYTVTYTRDFETTQKAGNYLGKDVWYFYSGSDITTYDHPELHKRFIISNDPIGADNKTLMMNLFPNDKDGNPNLMPRTELSGQPAMSGSANDEIYFHIRTYFPSSQKDIFEAEFVQFWLHASHPIPLQIEVRNGYFGARDPAFAGIMRFSPNIRLNDHLERWITWEVRAKFNRNGGYWRIYMDGKHVFTMSHSSMNERWTTSDQKWHPQFGIYANRRSPGHLQAYFDDLIIAKYTGIISVPNQPPEVHIISPQNNHIFTSPATIKISAEASDSDNTVSLVEFFSGTTLLGKTSTSPYSYSWGNVPSGNYTITARATDSKGASTTSTPVSFTVSDPLVDCNGDVNGSAFYDSCGICAGGNTGLEPNDRCNKKCADPILVYANDDNGHVAENTLDGDYNTGWSSDKQDAQIVYTLPCPVKLKNVEIAFYRGDQRKATFDIAVSADSSEWDLLFEGQSSGSTLEKQVFATNSPGTVKYVRIRGDGNTSNEWTSFTEVDFDYSLEADCNGVQGGTAFLNECNSTGAVKGANEHKAVPHSISSASNTSSFTLSQMSEIKFTLRTLNGRVVRSFSRIYGPGRHLIRLKRQQLPPGVYLCHLQVNAGKEKTLRIPLH